MKLRSFLSALLCLALLLGLGACGTSASPASMNSPASKWCRPAWRKWRELEERETGQGDKSDQIYCILPR